MSIDATSTPQTALVEEQHVRYEEHGALAIVTLDRPDRRNAINVAMAHRIRQIVDHIESTPELRVWILTANMGTSSVFCAGGDLTEVGAGRGGELSGDHGLAGFTHRPRTKPVIAAVDGTAVGGGCELVLACDLVVASPQASFLLPEVRRNLLASAGGVSRLPRAVGRRVALEAVLTAEALTAERCYQLGMVNRLVSSDMVLAAALGMAQAICRGAPAASRAAREIVLAADQDEAPLFARSRAESTRLRSMKDTAEGVAAFFERRDPRWENS